MRLTILFMILVAPILAPAASYKEKIDAYLAAHGATAEWELRDYSNGEPPVFFRWESTAPQPTLEQLPSDAAMSVPAEYRNFDAGTGEFTLKPDAEMVQVWTNTLVYKRAAIRNQFVGNILGVVGALGFTNLPVNWIEVSQFMIMNQTDPDVQRYGTFLNAQALFYDQWGGDLFNVNFEDVTCPYLQGE